MDEIDYLGILLCLSYILIWIKILNSKVNIDIII
jgi:hypothetical protein